MLLVLAAAPCALLAFVTVVGAGALRHGGPLVVVTGAAAIVALPALAPGAYVSRARRPVVVLLALLAWSLSVLAGFEVFFPGERDDACDTGLAITFVPSGLALPLRAFERALPSLGRYAQPPPPAAREMPAPPPAGKHQTEIATEAHGTTPVVAARAHGPGGAAKDLRLVFDTGATLTTLPERALAELGLAIPKDAPEVALGTASGELKAKLVLLDRLELGGLEVPFVTVAVCDACATRSADGLLGLNVSGQFLVTLDGAHGRILLERRAGAPNRALDVDPWLTVRASATTWLDGRVEVEVHVWNAAPRALSVVEIGVRCDRTYLVELHDLAPGATTSGRVRLPRGAECPEDYATLVARAAF